MFKYIVAAKNEEKLKTRFMANYKEGERRTLSVVRDSAALDSIAKKYNSAIGKPDEISDEDVFVFVHEDVKLPRDLDGMEKFLLDKAKTYGIVGVIGNKLNVGENWGLCPPELSAGAVVLKNAEGKLYRFFKGDDAEVAVVDGLFLSCSAALIKAFPEGLFDERIPGYHAYDSCVCLRARSKGFKVLAAEIPELFHDSTNKYPFEYIHSIAEFNNLYRDYLPDFCGERK